MCAPVIGVKTKNSNVNLQGTKLRTYQGTIVLNDDLIMGCNFLELCKVDASRLHRNSDHSNTDEIVVMVWSEFLCSREAWVLQSECVEMLSFCLGLMFCFLSLLGVRFVCFVGVVRLVCNG
jgi:hypothetical protein